MLASPWRRIVDSPAAPVALLALFAVLIALTINRFSVWIDESATLELVGPHGYGEIVRRAQYDTHPPLWYLTLKPWLQVFGTRVFASRLQAAVYMLAALAIWYRFVSTRFSRSLALLALALMVTNPMLLHYAVEGRMYAYGIFWTAVTCTLITGRWRWRWYAYWPCAVVMLYSHYFLVFVIGGQFLYLLLRRRELALTLRWLVLYGASIVAAFTPWLGHALHSTSEVVATGFWIGPVSPATVASYVLGTFLHRLDTELDGSRALPALIYIVTWMLSLFAARQLRRGPAPLLWCVLGVPWLALLVLSVTVPVFHPRYVIFSLPALITLVTAGALLATRWYRALAITVLIAGHLSGIAMLRWKGFHDTRGYWSMNEMAPELGKPVAGELPTVVSTWWFTYMDARASLPDAQPVVYLMENAPRADVFPEAIYYDVPGSYVLSLRDVHAHFVWLLEPETAPLALVPPSWRPLSARGRGYARARLFAVPSD